MKKAAVFLFLVIGAQLSGCGLPRDPGSATGRIEGGVLRVGVSNNPPWVSQNGAEFGGIEPDIVRGLASRVHAKTVWTIGSETRLVPALERGDLDLVIGGFPSDSPWASTVAVTRPYAESSGVKHVLLAPPGENHWLLTLDTFIAGEAWVPNGQAP
jgi:ABC-type amino acid transport substrate-binding protein